LKACGLKTFSYLSN